MHILGAIDWTVLNSYHIGVCLVVVTALIVTIRMIIKYMRDPNSKKDFSYLLKDESRPQTTRMHRISSDLHRFWRTRLKDKNVKFTAFCHDDVPDGLCVEPLPVYEIVNSLIGRAFYRTETGRIHLHVTFDKKTPETGVLNIIVANTGNGDLSPVYVGQSEKYEIFDLANFDDNINRIRGQYEYKTAPGRGTEFTITIPTDIYFPQQTENTETPTGKSKQDSSESKKGKPASNLVDMGQTDVTAMKSIELLGDDDQKVDKPEPSPKFDTMSPPKKQDMFDLGHRIDDLNLPNIPAVTKSLQNVHDLDVVESIQHLDVLIVEDQNSNSVAIRAMLEPLEHRVIYAENGEQALSLIKAHPFDFIIMDIHMPGVNGIEAAKIIRQSGQDYASIPIIALTADTTLSTAHNALGVGIDMVLTKPTTAAVLFEAIRASLESRSDVYIRPAHLEAKTR